MSSKGKSVAKKKKSHEEAEYQYEGGLAVIAEDAIKAAVEDLKSKQQA